MNSADSNPSSDALPLVGRLAPSPTGDLHMGHARSFLLAWWSIRSRGGRMLLRMEDLDRERVKPGSVDSVLRDFEWLGLDWDGPMQLQSDTEEYLHEAVQKLVDGGFAFPCFCTRKEISLSAPHVTDGERKYAGTCRDRFATEAEGVAALDRVAGLRFRCDPRELHLHDDFIGDFTSNPGEEVGDYLIRRRDGAIAYQLSVVVDDARSGVTEIFRGNDLLSSCSRQWLLQEALELPHPAWIHVPLVVDKEGRRLAKRDGDTTIASLRERGVDPRSLIAWVARSAGMQCEDRVTAAEVTQLFDLQSVPQDDVTFDSNIA